MATRINTKFVITLASALVLLVLGMVFAFTFLKKSAADHVKLAEAAMQRADEALAQGDVKLNNSELKRAANHFGAAKNKDSSNPSYLYGFIEAHEQVICENLTTAGNELDSILAGAANLHDTPGATDEDRLVLYEMLHERARMGLFTTTHNPIGSMLGFTTKRLDVAADDSIAKRYKAIAVSYMAQQRTKEDEIAEDLQAINESAKANADNPYLQAALARYHLGNGRRLFRVKGNTITDDVNASFTLALDHANAALKLAENNMPAYVEAAGLLAELRTSDEALMAQIAERQQDVARQLDAKLKDKANRDALFVEEIGRAAAILRLAGVNAEQGNEFNGAERAIALGQAVVADRPELPVAYQILGNLQHESNRFSEAEKTIESGLAIERLANAPAFIRDTAARLNMQSLLADIKCTLALQAADAEKREALLKASQSIIEKLAIADTLDPQWRDTRVDFLKGRVLLAQNQPRQAVTFLDRANQAYNNRDAQTLRLLAQTHSQLGNDALVAGYYETIIANNLRPSAEDLLNLINLYMNPGENQQLDKAEAQLAFYRKQLPNDLRAVRLQARLLSLQNKADEAIALLQSQDLEKNPDLLDMIAGLQAQSGNTESILKLMRDRIAARPAGEAMNLQMVTQLLNLLPEADAKRAELDRLVEQGLDAKIADVFRRVLTTGTPTMEDELALIDLQSTDPADLALRKFQTYRRWNQAETARPFLDKAIELAPKNPDVIDWRFRIALSEERYDDAQKAIDDMLKLPADERPSIALADGRFMRAQIQAVRASMMPEGEDRNKAFRQAIVSYNNALDQYSHYVDGWVQLGRLHLAQANYFAAQDSLREALSRQSRNVEALEMMATAQAGSGEELNAMERLEQVLTIQPNHPTALNQYTALAQQLGVTGRAIALREQIRDRVPSNYDNQRVLAALYAQSKAYDKATKTIQAVIQAQGSTRENIATLAQILALNEQHDKAIQTVVDYLAALGDQAAWQDHLLLARTYEFATKPELADAAFAKAIEMEKPAGTFLSTLSLAQTRLNRGQAQEAAALFEQLVKDFPENNAIKLQTAELYLQLREYDKAEAIASTMPASADRYRVLIQSASAQESKLGVAIQRAQEAVKAYPSDFGLRLNLVELLRIEQDRLPDSSRNYSKALTLAKTLARDYDDRVEAKVVLADVLLRMDQRAQATAELEKALAFAPRHMATNERLFGIKLAEAREMASTNPEASREKAREALAIISILIEGRPDLPTLLRNAGQAADLAGLSAQAVQYYRQSFDATASIEDLAAYATALLSANQGATARSVLEDPANATLVSNNLYLRALRGRALASSGQADLAATLFNNLLTQNKEPAERMLIARQITQAFGSDPARGVQIIESALGKDLPTDIDVMIASILISQKRFAQAAERLTKYASNPINDVVSQFFVMMQLALAQQESGALQEAKATYERVYKQMNEHKDLIPKRQQVQMLNNMAYLLADQLEGSADEAVRYAEQAIGLLSADVSPQEYALIEDTLGWAYFQAGRIDDAIRVLKDSVQKYPLVANQLHLGRAYLAKGDKDRALLVLEAALNMAKSQNDEKMIAETQKWYRQAL